MDIQERKPTITQVMLGKRVETENTTTKSFPSYGFVHGFLLYFRGRVHFEHLLLGGRQLIRPVRFEVLGGYCTSQAVRII